MKTQRWFELLAVAGSLLMCSCALLQQPVALAPVGPALGNQSALDPTAYLKVYTEVRRSSYKVSDVWDYPYYQEGHYFAHTDYAIYNAAGECVKNVQNAETVHSLTPKQVVLPPGQYTVVGWSDDYQLVKVPVLIKAGSLTTVNLERKNHEISPSDKSAELVYAPDGRIVGWTTSLATR